MRPDAYFICGTPRTGSTLLCALLKSSGIAGVPESYYRAQDSQKWADKWKLASDFSFTDYLKASIDAGTTDNGIFAARIMWGTMEELTNNLRSLYLDIETKDSAILTKAYGRCRFIYIKRNDYVAQAVSLWRALQTDHWHSTEAVKDKIQPEELLYDFNRIQDYVREAEGHNAAWIEWFTKNDIEPLTIEYEELSADPVKETMRILNYLELSLPANITLSAGNKRMADALSQDWIERFHNDSRP